MKKLDTLERISTKCEIDEETGCWIYQGGKTQKGYGLIYYNGKMHSVHRVAYEVSDRTIPPGFDVHHTCGNRACCRIEHLRAIPHRLNTTLTAEYIALRWERLKTLLSVNFDLALFGLTHVTSRDLSTIWGKSCRGGNLVNYLKTLAFVFEDDFECSLIKKGAGRRPHLFKIKISERLRERLEDAEHDASLPLFNPLTDDLALFPSA